jgi:hypothetical protein
MEQLYAYSAEEWSAVTHAGTQQANRLHGSSIGSPLEVLGS